MMSCKKHTKPVAASSIDSLCVFPLPPSVLLTSWFLALNDPASYLLSHKRPSAFCGSLQALGVSCVFVPNVEIVEKCVRISHNSFTCEGAIDCLAPSLL